MKLVQAVDDYVRRRRSAGSPFVSSEATLQALCRACGDIDAAQLTVRSISDFVARPHTAAVTQVSKFSAVRMFVRDCVERDLLRSLELVPPPKPRSRRLPFIYTHDQVRTLLVNTAACQATASKLAPETFRLALLLLYSTGASLEEVLSLRRTDVELKRGQIHFKAGAFRPARCVPIDKSLSAALVPHLRSSSESELIIRTRRGQSLSRKDLEGRFKRLLRLSGIKPDVSGHVPRLQDFRYTFAVHRLNAWIEARSRLDQLIPALSTYMGYSSLLKAEEFLTFTPERFRTDLQKLSPAKRRGSWREDQNLMAFLSRL